MPETHMFKCVPVESESICSHAFHFNGTQYCAELFRRAVRENC